MISIIIIYILTTIYLNNLMDGISLLNKLLKGQKSYIKKSEL